MDQNLGGVHKVFGGIKSQTLVTIILGVIEIVFFSIMSRILNQEDFGYFAIITAVTSILTTLTEVGMGSTLIQKKDPSEYFVSTAFTISFAFGAIASLSLFVAAPYFSKIMIGDGTLTVAFRLMALPLLLSNINSIARATMMRQLNFLRFGLYQIISYVLSNGIAVCVALRGHTFYAIIIAAVLNQLFLTILLYSFKTFRPTLRIYKEELSGIIVFGGWLTGSAIIRSISEQLDKFILARWMSVSALGAYNRPSGFISNITSKIYGVFDVVLYPILSRIQDEQDRMNRSYQLSVVLTSLFSCVLMSIFILGSASIISIFFGSKWLNLVNVFQILSISIIAISYCRIADVFFRSSGAVKQYFWNRVISCLFTVLSLYIGCRYGIIGASIAFTISKYIDMIVKIIMFRRIISVNRSNLYKSLFNACLIPILILLICYPLLRIGNIIAISLYILILTLIILVKPSAFGNIFYECVYNQYLKNIVCKFGFRKKY